MDMETYRDALLQKRAELLGGTAAKPLQWTMENNSGRQGDMADQASGNNEVHIQLKLKQTDAKILQAIEEALQPHRAGHLRRLPRLRRADRRGAAERDSVDARLHHLQGKAEGVAHVTAGRAASSSSPISPPSAWRCCSATRPAPASSATTTSTTPTSTSSAARRRTSPGCRTRWPSSARRCRRRRRRCRCPAVAKAGKKVEPRRVPRRSSRTTRRDARAFVDAGAPRSTAMTHARHRIMLDVVLGESLRAQAPVRAGRRRVRGPARPPHRRCAGASAPCCPTPVDGIDADPVAIALGSNLGDPRALPARAPLAALDALHPRPSRLVVPRHRARRRRATQPRVPERRRRRARRRSRRATLLDALLAIEQRLRPRAAVSRRAAHARPRPDSVR